MRETDLCLLTEVWQVKESKKHLKAIESMMEMNGILPEAGRQAGRRHGYRLQGGKFPHLKTEHPNSKTT